MVIKNKGDLILQVFFFLLFFSHGPLSSGLFSPAILNEHVTNSTIRESVVFHAAILSLLPSSSEFFFFVHI